MFVSPNNHAALACAREADELMTGRIGVMGTPAEHWYYAGRDHLFFAVEADIHRGGPTALALPPEPPGCANGSPGAGSSRWSRLACFQTATYEALSSVRTSGTDGSRRRRPKTVVLDFIWFVEHNVLSAPPG